MSSSRATSIYSAPIEIKEDLRQTTKLGGCAVGSRAIYQEGNGTLDNPYVIKYFNE